MKKILSIISAGVLALFASSCVQEDLRTFDPSNATAPVLQSYTLDENGITASYTPGAFNMGFNSKVPVNHTLVLATADGKTVGKTVSATDDGSTLVASASTISKLLTGLGYEEGASVSLDLFIRAMMQGTVDNGSGNGSIDSEGHITGSFVVTVPKGNPWKDYTETSPWGVTGAIAALGINWDKDIAMSMTEDGTKHVARGVKLAASDQFKFRKDGGWTDNFGGEGDVEPFVVSLGTEYPAAAGGKNLAVPADGVYDLMLDTQNNTFTVTEAFLTYPGFDEASAWSVIGSIASFEMNWDKDIAMITDGTWHVAEGVVLKASDQFKFRKDQAWTDNFGAEGDVEPFVVDLDTEYPAAAGGKNLAVSADGTYDLLVNPDGKLFKVVESLGGKSGLIGGDEPEPDKPAVWSLIGTIGGSAWDTDTDMTNTTGDIWVARSVSLTADDEFKIRADHDWGTSYGGPEANSTSTIDPSNPYDVYKPVLGEAFAAGDKNIQVGVEGLYDITFDYAAMTILVEEHVAAYSLIGSINGSSWDKDIIMSEKDGVWTSPVVQIDGAFKIRFDFSWADENTYGVEEGFTPTVGEPFTAVQPGKDISVEPGQYKVQFTPETKEVLIKAVNFPEHLYMIGEEFGNWDWNSDGVVEMTPVLHNPEWGADAEGQFWTVRYFSAGKGFKFNSVREWGGDFWGLTTNDGFTEAGGNCVVAEDGFYMVHIDLKNEKVHVEPARIYGIGEAFGGWDEGMEAALFKADGKTLKVTVASAGNLRMYAASDIATSGWWTREFNIFDGKIVNRLMDELGAVSVNAGQEVVLDFNAGTGEIKGEGEAPALPETMYIIGDAVGGWDWEANGQDMIPVNGKAGQFWAIRYLEAGKGFKFCPVKEWKGDFTGLGEDTGYTVDGGNCFVAENGVYMIYVDTNNKKLCVEPAKVYGKGECFGGWDADPVAFSIEGDKVVGKTAAAGEIRMYADCSIATSDWWTREFVFFDGKIAYRGNGGDQERVKVEAGKTVTLDFNAGTAVVE